MAKSDKFYFENFAQCTAMAKDAAKYLARSLENYNPDEIERTIAEIHEIENNADKKRHEMGRALAKAFVTPLDREDLDRLSHDLDNVTDHIEDVVQKLYINNIQTIKPAAITFAHHLVNACDILCKIMGEFENFKKTKKIHGLIVELNDIEEECDKLYLHSVRDLMKDPTDAFAMISWREIYDCLEACIDTCEHVSESIGSVIMKNT